MIDIAEAKQAMGIKPSFAEEYFAGPESMPIEMYQPSLLPQNFEVVAQQPTKEIFGDYYVFYEGIDENGFIKMSRVAAKDLRVEHLQKQMLNPDYSYLYYQKLSAKDYMYQKYFDYSKDYYSQVEAEKMNPQLLPGETRSEAISNPKYETGFWDAFNPENMYEYWLTPIGYQYDSPAVAAPRTTGHYPKWRQRKAVENWKKAIADDKAKLMNKYKQNLGSRQIS